MSAGAHNIITPGVRGFDRIVTGPVESLDVPDWMDIFVGGELYLPKQMSGQSYEHFTTWSLEQLSYRLIVPADVFKRADMRPYLEKKIRGTLVDTLLDCVPINMRYEGLARY